MGIIRKIIYSMLILFIFIGCGNISSSKSDELASANDEPSSTSTDNNISGIVFANYVQNADIKVYGIDKNGTEVYISTTKSDTDGLYSLSINKDLSYEQYVIYAIGGSYIDEATFKVVTLTEPLKSITYKNVDGSIDEVAITPATDIVVTSMINQKEYNKDTRKSISLALSTKLVGTLSDKVDLFSTLPVDLENSNDENSTSSDDEMLTKKIYSSVLSGLSQLQSDSNKSIFEISKDIASEIELVKDDNGTVVVEILPTSLLSQYVSSLQNSLRANQNKGIETGVETVGEISKKVETYIRGKAYKPGDIVVNKGNSYECKAWPEGGWCALGAYAPGDSLIWTAAWTKLTNNEVIEESTSVAEKWSSSKKYLGGDKIYYQTKVYECAQWPYTAWCSTREPGTLGWKTSWIKSEGKISDKISENEQLLVSLEKPELSVTQTDEKYTLILSVNYLNNNNRPDGYIIYKDAKEEERKEWALDESTTFVISGNKDIDISHTFYVKTYKVNSVDNSIVYSPLSMIRTITSKKITEKEKDSLSAQSFLAVNRSSFENVEIGTTTKPIVITGGDGNGEIQIEVLDDTIASAHLFSYDNNTSAIVIVANSVGFTSIKLYKAADSNYLQSNVLTLNVDVIKKKSNNVINNIESIYQSIHEYKNRNTFSVFKNKIDMIHDFTVDVQAIDNNISYATTKYNLYLVNLYDTNVTQLTNTLENTLENMNQFISLQNDLLDNFIENKRLFASLSSDINVLRVDINNIKSHNLNRFHKDYDDILLLNSFGADYTQYNDDIKNIIIEQRAKLISFNKNLEEDLNSSITNSFPNIDSFVPSVFTLASDLLILTDKKKKLVRLKKYLEDTYFISIDTSWNNLKESTLAEILKIKVKTNNENILNFNILSNEISILNLDITNIRELNIQKFANDMNKTLNLEEVNVDIIGYTQSLKDEINMQLNRLRTFNTDITEHLNSYLEEEYPNKDSAVPSVFVSSLDLTTLTDKKNELISIKLAMNNFFKTLDDSWSKLKSEVLTSTLISKLSFNNTKEKTFTALLEEISRLYDDINNTSNINIQQIQNSAQVLLENSLYAEKDEYNTSINNAIEVERQNVINFKDSVSSDFDQNISSSFPTLNNMVSSEYNLSVDLQVIRDKKAYLTDAKSYIIFYFSNINNLWDTRKNNFINNIVNIKSNIDSSNADELQFTSLKSIIATLLLDINNTSTYYENLITNNLSNDLSSDELDFTSEMYTKDEKNIFTILENDLYEFNSTMLVDFMSSLNNKYPNRNSVIPNTYTQDVNLSILENKKTELENVNTYVNKYWNDIFVSFQTLEKSTFDNVRDYKAELVSIKKQEFILLKNDINVLLDDINISKTSMFTVLTDSIKQTLNLSLLDTNNSNYDSSTNERILVELNKVKDFEKIFWNNFTSAVKNNFQNINTSKVLSEYSSMEELITLKDRKKVLTDLKSFTINYLEALKKQWNSIKESVTTNLLVIEGELDIQDITNFELWSNIIQSLSIDINTTIDFNTKKFSDSLLDKLSLAVLDSQAFIYTDYKQDSLANQVETATETIIRKRNLLVEFNSTISSRITSGLQSNFPNRNSVIPTDFNSSNDLLLVKNKKIELTNVKNYLISEFQAINIAWDNLVNRIVSDAQNFQTHLITSNNNKFASFIDDIQDLKLSIDKLKSTNFENFLNRKVKFLSTDLLKYDSSDYNETVKNSIIKEKERIVVFNNNISSELDNFISGSFPNINSVLPSEYNSSADLLTLSNKKNILISLNSAIDNFFNNKGSQLYTLEESVISNVTNIKGTVNIQEHSEDNYYSNIPFSNKPTTPTIAYYSPNLKYGETFEFTWNMHWGTKAKAIKLYIDGELQNTKRVYDFDTQAGAQSGNVVFPMKNEVTTTTEYTFYIELCNDNNQCTKSDTKTISYQNATSEGNSGGTTWKPAPVEIDPDPQTVNGVVPLTIISPAIHVPSYLTEVGHKEIAGYYGQWKTYGRDYQISDIPVHKLNLINYAFIDVDSEGIVRTVDSYADYKKIIINSKVAVNSIPNGYIYKDDNNNTNSIGYINKDTFRLVSNLMYEVEGVLESTKSGGAEIAKFSLAGNIKKLMLLKVKYPHLKIYPSFGGWTLSDHFYAVAADPVKRERFAKSALDYVRKFGFDGIDIDWEFPVRGGEDAELGSSQDRQNHTLLMQALRDAIDSDPMIGEVSTIYPQTVYGVDFPNGIEHPNYINKKLGLTEAVYSAPEDPKLAGVDYQATKDIVDTTNIMSYDYHGAWEAGTGKTGHQSALFSNNDHFSDYHNTDASFEKISRDHNYTGSVIVNSKNIAVGFGFYGRSAADVDSNTNNGYGQTFQSANVFRHPNVDPELYEAAGTADYIHLKNIINKDGYVRYWDNIAKVPYLYNSEKREFFTYEDQASIALKTAYFWHKKNTNIFFWELSGDTEATQVIEIKGIKYTVPKTGDMLGSVHTAIQNINYYEENKDSGLFFEIVDNTQLVSSINNKYTAILNFKNDKVEPLVILGNALDSFDLNISSIDNSVINAKLKYDSYDLNLDIAVDNNLSVLNSDLNGILVDMNIKLNQQQDLYNKALTEYIEANKQDNSQENNITSYSGENIVENFEIHKTFGVNSEIVATYNKLDAINMQNIQFVISGFEYFENAQLTCSGITFINATKSYKTNTGKHYTILSIDYDKSILWYDRTMETGAECSITFSPSRIDNYTKNDINLEIIGKDTIVDDNNENNENQNNDDNTEYTKYPDNIDNYELGTIVKASDGKLYKCTGYTSWCKIPAYDPIGDYGKSTWSLLSDSSNDDSSDDSTHENEVNVLSDEEYVNKETSNKGDRLKEAIINIETIPVSQHEIINGQDMGPDLSLGFTNVQRVQKIFKEKFSDLIVAQASGKINDFNLTSSGLDVNGLADEDKGRLAWEWLFPMANGHIKKFPAEYKLNVVNGDYPYTYTNFLKSIAKYPKLCGDHVDVDGDNADTLCKLSMAMMFAHFTQETGAQLGQTEANILPFSQKLAIPTGTVGSAGIMKNFKEYEGVDNWFGFDNGIDMEGATIPQYRQALYWVQEVECSDNMPESKAGCEYRDYGDISVNSFPVTKNPKTGLDNRYFGRGPKQLSYNYNYGLFSKIIYDDVNVLLEEPSKVTDGWLAFGSASYFFMQPRVPKPSMYELIYGKWQANNDATTDGLSRDIGTSIVIINGAIECGSGDVSRQADNRVKFYSGFLDYFNLIDRIDLDNRLDTKYNCKDSAVFDKPHGAAYDSYWAPQKWLNDCNLVSYPTPYSAYIDGNYKRCYEQGLLGLEESSNNVPKVIGTINNIMININESHSSTLVYSDIFSDSDDDNLTYSISGLPNGFEFNTTSGVLSGTATIVNNSIITLLANDGKSSTYINFNIIVTDPSNVAPIVLNPIEDKILNEKESFTYEISSSVFSDVNGDTLIYTIENLPVGFNFANNIISTSSVSIGEHNFTVVASDGSLNVKDTFILTVNNIPEPPVVNKLISDKSIIHNVNYSYIIPSDTFIDPDEDQLTYSISGLPDGLSLKENVILGAAIGEGNYTITLTATDGNFSVNTQFLISVTNSVIIDDDYLTYPSNLGKYKSGDIVKGSDGNLYKCKINTEAWCNGSSSFYDPVSGIAASSAWDLIGNGNNNDDEDRTPTYDANHTYPVYPENRGSYVVGDIVKDSDDVYYECLVANQCNDEESKNYVPGTGSQWILAWSKVDFTKVWGSKNKKEILDLFEQSFKESWNTLIVLNYIGNTKVNADGIEFIISTIGKPSSVSISNIHGIGWPSTLIKDLGQDDNNRQITQVTLSFDQYANRIIQTSGELLTIGFTLSGSDTDKQESRVISIREVPLPSTEVIGAKYLLKDDAISLKVKGWPSYFAHGAVTDNSVEVDESLSKVKLNTIFKYVGDGNGDKGTLIDPIDYRKTLRQTRVLEKLRETNGESNVSMFPTMVLYMANGSGGGGAEIDIKPHYYTYETTSNGNTITVEEEDLSKDFNNSNVVIHFRNLIRLLSEMQANKDDKHPSPASVVVNPDLLGQWQLNTTKSNPLLQIAYCGGSDDINCEEPQNLQIRRVIKTAIELEKDYMVRKYSETEQLGNNEYTVEAGLVKNLYALDSIKAEIDANIGNDFKGWAKGINLMFKKFAPDVSFGWLINVWNNPEAGGGRWVHNEPNAKGEYDIVGLKSIWDKASKGVVDFIDFTEIYEDNEYRPDFLPFDKYEGDGFAERAAANAWSYGQIQWERTLTYVKQITDYLDIPAMLWQIPGGHLVSELEASQGTIVSNNAADDENLVITLNGYTITDGASTSGTYFMGDKNIGTSLSNVYQPLREYTRYMDHSFYQGTTNVGNFLEKFTDDSYDWSQSNLRRAAHSNIFAILWGGGETTGVVPISTNTDGDNNWLKGKINHYMESGKLPLYYVEDNMSEDNNGITDITSLNSELNNAEDEMDSGVLMRWTGGDNYVPSEIYKWNDFLVALSAMHNTGVGSDKYWLYDKNGTNEETNKKYAKVAIAAFLAQSIQETIQYDACDENSWQFMHDVDKGNILMVDSYNRGDFSTSAPMDAACGQIGQVYTDYGVDSYGVDNPYSCPRTPKMEASAVTNARYYGAPGPIFAAPDAVLDSLGLLVNGKPGRWIGASTDTDEPSHKNCTPQPAIEDGFEVEKVQGWLKEDCKIYKGQKHGNYSWDGTSKKSLEGCTWWGRGVIQTTGRENFGKLNHFMARSHVNKDIIGKDISWADTKINVLAPPTNPLYADIDLCSNPELVCTSKKHKDIKWIAGLFFWINSVQSYSGPGKYANWNYQTELKKYVDSDFGKNNYQPLNGISFIDSVSGIVNRGCPDLECSSSGEVHAAHSRAKFFKNVMSGFGIAIENTTRSDSGH